MANKRILKEGHYRNVMKSDHLSVPDLEDLIDKGTPLIFTIDYVQQEYDVKVAGKLMSGNIAYFKDKGIKPLVLNSINNKRIREFVPNKSPLIQFWKDILIELYIDENVKFGNEKTGGVRVKVLQPKPIGTIVELPILSDNRFAIALQKLKDKDPAISKNQLTDNYMLSEYQLQKLGEI